MKKTIMNLIFNGGGYAKSSNLENQNKLQLNTCIDSYYSNGGIL